MNSPSIKSNSAPSKRERIREKTSNLTKPISSKINLSGNHKISNRISNRIETKKVKKMDDAQLDFHYDCAFLDDYINTIETGDIFLMSGTELFSRVIKRACMTTWSHICMAIVDPPRSVVEALAIPAHWNSRVFIFESDTETWDEREGGGVQLVDLKEYLIDIYKFYGPTFLFVTRKLRIPFQTKPFWEEFPSFVNWLLLQKGKGYKKSKAELAGSAYGLNIIQDPTKVFCSEIIALAFQYIGILPRKGEGGKRANNYVPRDFSSKQRFDGKDILLRNGCYFEKEKRIKLRNPPPMDSKEQKSSNEEIIEITIPHEHISLSE